MSNTFNINRFGLVLRRQWLEFGKIFLISLGVIAGALILLYAFNIPLPNKRFFMSEDAQLKLNFREPLFLVTGFLFITIVASNYFAQMGQKSKAMVELMLPASTLEKFIAGVFFTSIVSVFSYVFVFYVIDLAFVNYVNSAFIEANPTNTPHANGLYGLYIGSKDVKPLYAVPFLCISLFLLGSIYFGKYHYIKTAISVMVFSGIISYIFYRFGRLLFDGKMRINNENPFRNVDSNTILSIVTVFIFLLSIVFWIIGYVRLKEKEV